MQAQQIADVVVVLDNQGAARVNSVHRISTPMV
jgi:hypothetical protein